MVFGLSSQTFFPLFIQFLLFYLIWSYHIHFIFQSLLQQSLNQHLLARVQLKMKATLYGQNFEVDQERKIMQQIQAINKKLSAHSHSSKNVPSQISLLKTQQDPQQKYFSQQCDDLFAQHHFPVKPDLNNPLDESLFNSNNSLLLGNQFEKQVRNFPQFSTNQLSGQNQAQAPNESKSGHLNELTKANGCNSRSFQGRQSQKGVLKNSINILSNNFTSKNSSQASLSKKTASISSKNKVNQRLSCEKKSISKLIQNKENIQANLNTSKQPFIKQIKKRIRFETQPDEHNFQNQYFQSFQRRKLQKNGKNIESLIQKFPKNKSNPNSGLQCTFKPSILKKSHDIAQNLQPSFERLTQDLIISKSQSKLPYKTKQQLTDKKYSVKRLQKLSQPRKQKEQTDKEEPNYDFRPTLSKKSLSQMANCTMDVASRNKLWLQQKQAKLLRLKEEEEEKKIKKQTGSFVPKITPYKGQNQVHLSRFTKQGISSYFERVSMAKQKIQVIEKKKLILKEEVKEVNACMKKKTYDEAVKELHKKILTMNI